MPLKWKTLFEVGGLGRAIKGKYQVKLEFLRGVGMEP